MKTMDEEYNANGMEIIRVEAEMHNYSDETKVTALSSYVLFLQL